MGLFFPSEGGFSRSCGYSCSVVLHICACLSSGGPVCPPPQVPGKPPLRVPFGRSAVPCSVWLFVPFRVLSGHLHRSVFRLAVPPFRVPFGRLCRSVFRLAVPTVPCSAWLFRKGWVPLFGLLGALERLGAEGLSELLELLVNAHPGTLGHHTGAPPHSPA